MVKLMHATCVSSFVYSFVFVLTSSSDCCCCCCGGGGGRRGCC